MTFQRRMENKKFNYKKQQKKNIYKTKCRKDQQLPLFSPHN